MLLGVSLCKNVTWNQSRLHPLIFSKNLDLTLFVPLPFLEIFVSPTFFTDTPPKCKKIISPFWNFQTFDMNMGHSCKKQYRQSNITTCVKMFLFLTNKVQWKTNMLSYLNFTSWEVWFCHHSLQSQQSLQALCF